VNYLDMQSGTDVLAQFDDPWQEFKITQWEGMLKKHKALMNSDLIPAETKEKMTETRPEDIYSLEPKFEIDEGYIGDGVAFVLRIGSIAN